MLAYSITHFHLCKEMGYISKTKLNLIIRLYGNKHKVCRWLIVNVRFRINIYSVSSIQSSLIIIPLVCVCIQMQSLGLFQL